LRDIQVQVFISEKYDKNAQTHIKQGHQQAEIINEPVKGVGFWVFSSWF
jgi:hypothetical protein